MRQIGEGDHAIDCGQVGGSLETTETKIVGTNNFAINIQFAFQLPGLEFFKLDHAYRAVDSNMQARIRIELINRIAF